MYSPEEQSIIKELVAQWAEDADIDEALAYYKQKKTEQPTSIKDVLGGITTKLQWAGKQVVEGGQSLVTNTIRWVGNIAALWVKSTPWIADVLLPWTPIKDVKNRLAGRIARWTEKIASGIEWINKDLSTTSTGAKVWEFASYLTPSIWAEKAAVKWMSGMSKLITKFPKLWSIATWTTRWLAGGAGYEAAQKWTIGKDTLTQWGIWAAFPIAWMALNLLGKWAATILGATAGTGTSIKESFKAGLQWGKAQAENIAGLTWKISADDLLSKEKDALKILRDNKKIVYGDRYGKFLEESSKKWVLDNTDLLNTFTRKLKEYGAVVPKDLEWTWAKLDEAGKSELMKNMFAKSSVVDPNQINQISQILDDLSIKFRKSSLDSLDTLKHRVQGRIEMSWDNPILVDTYNAITKKIQSNSKVYTQMQDEYGKMTGVIKEISESLKPNGNKATAVTKLQNALKDNTGLRQEVLDQLEKLSGIKLKPAIAWVAAQNLVPTGLRGAGIGFAIATTASVNPTLIPYFLASSPKVTSGLWLTLGISKRKMLEVLNAIRNKTGNVLPENIVRNLLAPKSNP